MRITARISTATAKAATRIAALVAGIAIVAGSAACGFGSASPSSSTSAASSSSTEQDSPITIVAAENTWGTVASQIAGDEGSVTPIVSDTDTDMSTFAPDSDQKTLIANAQVVVVTGAGYDSWASDLVSQGQTIVNAASTIGASTGDNPYLWMSADARKAVAKAIADSLTKLRPDASDTFSANLDAWQSEENATEDAIADFAKQHDGLSYVATTPVAYYLMSEVNAKDATPQEWSAASAKGTTPDGTAIAKFTLALKGFTGDTGLLITDSQRTNSAVDTVLGTEQARTVPAVTLTETMPLSETSLPQWIAGIVEQMDTELDEAKPTSGASASASESASTSSSASADASGSTASSAESASSTTN